ncbi:hypothetical protein J6590_031371 [Homalodisca vitripennis]|nr:hypothetical protein J6590_031371 [Homalodisca vitripennis]
MDKNTIISTPLLVAPSKVFGSRFSERVKTDFPEFRLTDTIRLTARKVKVLEDGRHGEPTGAAEWSGREVGREVICIAHVLEQKKLGHDPLSAGDALVKTLADVCLKRSVPHFTSHTPPLKDP